MGHVAIEDRCGDCREVIPPPKPQRICYLCQKPMGRHDKYFVDPLEVKYSGLWITVSAFRHRHCDNPTDYWTRKERLKWFKENGISARWGISEE